MFEKEAEEYSNNWKINKNNDLNFAELVELRAVIYKANKDGAEFGFQKGIKARVNTTTISDCPVKNEWHYPSKGEYPDENKIVLIYAKNEEGYGHDFMTYHKDNGWYGYGTYIEEVIAWKELDIPEES